MRDVSSPPPRGSRPELKMTPEFHRIRRLPPYVFEEVNRIKARLRGEGVDIIDSRKELRDRLARLLATFQHQPVPAA